jgi:hypothetical protein
MALVVAVKSGTCFIREQTLFSPRHLLATRESRSNVILTDRTVNNPRVSFDVTRRLAGPAPLGALPFEPFHKIWTRLPFLEPPRLCDSARRPGTQPPRRRPARKKPNAIRIPKKNAARRQRLEVREVRRSICFYLPSDQIGRISRRRHRSRVWRDANFKLIR